MSPLSEKAKFFSGLKRSLALMSAVKLDRFNQFEEWASIILIE